MKTRLTLVKGLDLLLLLSTIADQPSTFAQGTAFTYQGRLNDGANPANGIYDLRFAIYNGDIGGTPLGGLLTNSATGVSNGLLTVTLDFGNQFPGAARWLEIGVRSNGGGAFSVLSPRQQIRATPYAITAGNVTGPVAAANITGTLPVTQLPPSVVTNGASGVNFTGTFSGNGAGITGVNVSTLRMNQAPVAAWGNNFYGQTTIPVGLSNVVAIAAGGYHGLALRQQNVPATLALLNGNNVFHGTISAPGFTGNGDGLTNLDASKISSGTLADARLSANVALRAGGNSFTGNQSMSGSLDFGAQTRQMLNLWNAEYAIGVQSDALYFRTGNDYHWYRGGSHSDVNGNAGGGGGVPLMSLNRSGFLGLGTTTPSFPLDVQSGLAVGRFTTTNNANGAVLALRNNTASPTYLGAINFEDSGTPGQIAYLASGQMTFRVGGADKMNLRAGGLYVDNAIVLTSDRNAKQDFAAVDAQEVLEKVAALPLQSWSYTNRPGVKHVGPMAQDFRAAFGLGEDDKHIATVDADGVALAAIQGLNQKLTDELRQKGTEITELKQRLDALEKIIINQKSN